MFKATVVTPFGEIDIIDKEWDWPGKWEKTIPIPDDENILFDPEQLNPSKI